MTAPNILFILSDQHNHRYVNSPDVATPSLDALSREGMNFRQAYCQNPLCVPSRANLITGRYSRHTGIYDNRHILESNGETLPRVLGRAGYRTALIGKSHFNGEQYQGYQERPYGDFYGQAHQPDPRRTPDKGESGLGDILGDAGPSGIPLPLTQTEICVAEASKWLQGHVAQAADKPFLLSLHFDKPHFPINPPQRFFDHYAGKVTLPEFPEGWLETAPSFIQTAVRNSGTNRHAGDRAVHARALAAYLGCIEWIDDAIGRVLEVLDYLGLSDNTIVIYTSDHGEMGAHRGVWQKTLFFDDSARLPLIVRWPGHHAPGANCDQIVGLIDFFPTLCAAAGIAIPDGLDGVSLLPALSGQSIARDGIFCESVALKQPDYAGAMLRTVHWKYARYLDGAEELYDMRSDPDEWTNLAGRPEQAQRCADFAARVSAFFDFEGFRQRYDTTPRMRREKHFYPYSNQFHLGNGIVIDGRP